jgi:hypothetical protein
MSLVKGTDPCHTGDVLSIEWSGYRVHSNVVDRSDGCPYHLRNRPRGAVLELEESNVWAGGELKREKKSR